MAVRPDLRQRLRLDQVAVQAGADPVS
jgi:hypothetical protein